MCCSHKIYLCGQDCRAHEETIAGTLTTILFTAPLRSVALILFFL